MSLCTAGFINAADTVPPPSISRHPQSTTNEVCREARFSVEAQGSSPLQYAWRLDNHAISDGDHFSGTAGSQLVVRDLRHTHAGNYDVIIRDSASPHNATTSRVAVLTVKPDARWVLRAADGPPARFGHGMVYDSARKVMVMFGGRIGWSAISPLSDLWEWDGARWAQRVEHTASNGWIQVPGIGWRPSYQDHPVRRAHFGMAYDSARGRAVVFGGWGLTPDGSLASLRDLWEWDGERWHFRGTNGPVARVYGSMAFDERRRRTVLFGGQPLPGVNETQDTEWVWEWDGERWHTNSPPANPSNLNNRSQSRMTYDSHRGVIVFGPTLENISFWSFWDWNGIQWTNFPVVHFSDPVVTVLHGTSSGGFAFDASRRRSLWFGGINSVPHNKTALFDGKQWTLPTVETSPPARVLPAVAYDSLRQVTVMFGGSSTFSGDVGATNDTWEFTVPAPESCPDRVPPVIRCPVDGLAANATRPCGAVVTFTVSATDDSDRPPSVVCTPPSGSLFPRGTTVVACVATDAAGNTAQCSFPLFVGGGPEFPPPVPVSVAPRILGTAGGTQIKITGDNLTPDDEVLLDGVPLAHPLWVNAREIQGQAPALAAGTHEMTIRRCGDIVARLAGACSSGAMRRILSIDPRQSFARGGGWVTVDGTNLLPATRVRVDFGAPDGTGSLLVNATVSADGTTLTGQMPPLPTDALPGPRDVIVSDERGSDVLRGGISYVPDPFETDPQTVSLRSLQAASTVQVTGGMRQGFPAALNGRIPVAGATPEERATGFVRTYAGLLRLQNPDAEMAVTRVAREGLDDVRLAQNYRGVPVFGAEIVVTLASNEVWAMTGNLTPSAFLDAQAFNLSPQLTQEQAIERARADEGIQMPAAALNARAELVVYDPSLFADIPRNPRLAWMVTMNFSAHELMVDANTGEIAARLPLERHHDIDLDVQDAKNQFSTTTTRTCLANVDTEEVADEDDFNSDYDDDMDAVLAKRFANACWDYFHDVFDWHSYDGANSQLEVFIHTTINPGNVANWIPACRFMQFVDGAVEYEIMVHEFTHGIISSTSGLQYQFESGALDESYADTMAVIADRERGELETAQPVNWTIGENRRAPQPTTAIRNFDNPPSHPTANQPDIYPNLCCTAALVGLPTAGNDFGGVHRNSGIPNKAGHLMIEGGTFRTFPVAGLGPHRVRQIKFSAMRNLPNNANFLAARAREIAAAQWFAQHGQHGFTSSHVCSVRNAWAAVGVGLPDTNCDGIEEANDADGDLIPNHLDNCPYVANPGQEDPDGDGVGGTQVAGPAGAIIRTGCDNCPNTANPGQENSDGDADGDHCDNDIDGDGCLNNVDQDPNSDLHRIGTSFDPACPERSSIQYGFAGINPNPFVAGSRSYCEDLDDDDDGVPDWGADGVQGTADDDPCPIGRLPNSISGECAVFDTGGCPQTPKNWYEVCFGSGCVEFFARFEDIINPSPVTTTYVEQIRIVNETLFLQPGPGASVSRLADRIARVSPQRLADVEGPSRIRVEIWARGTASDPPRLVAVAGEYDPALLTIGQLNSGRMLALEFQNDTAAATLGGTWNTGTDPAAAAADSDGDGMPDGWESLHGLDPLNPVDATMDSDRDGSRNLAEFEAGTSPSDAGSVFRIVGLRRLPGRVEVDCVGTPGRRFRLEQSDGIIDSIWVPVGVEVRGRGGAVVVADPNPGPATAVFYRVRSLAD